MILGSLSSIVFNALAAAGVMSLPAQIVIRDDMLLLGDVADMQVLPMEMRDRAAALSLMKLPSNSDPVTLRKSDIAARARSLMPSLAPWFGDDQGAVTILRRSADPLRPVATASQVDGIAKDDRVTVTVIAGIFSIERQAVALNDAKTGDRLFVRTEDRKALSVLCCGE